MLPNNKKILMPAHTAQSLADLQNHFDAYTTLIDAGKNDEALILFRKLNLRDVLYHTFGEHHKLIELLSPLFPDGLTQLPALKLATDQAWAINALSMAMSGLGRNDPALALVGLTLRLAYEEHNAREMGTIVRNYGITLSSLNRLEASLRADQLALALAEAADDKIGAAMSRLTLFTDYVYFGMSAEADRMYDAFQANPPAIQRDYWLADAAHWQVTQLIYAGGDAESSIEALVDLAERGKNTVAKLLLPYLRGEDALNKADFISAQTHFTEAVSVARQSGIPTLITKALGGQARAFAALGQFEDARHILASTDAEIKAIDRAEVTLALYNALHDPADHASSLENAYQAYKQASTDGEPYVHRWVLNRAIDVFEALGEAPPTLPLHNPATAEKIPYEDEIRAWVAELEAKKSANNPN